MTETTTDNRDTTRQAQGSRDKRSCRSYSLGGGRRSVEVAITCRFVRGHCPFVVQGREGLAGLAVVADSLCHSHQSHQGPEPAPRTRPCIVSSRTVRVPARQPSKRRACASVCVGSRPCRLLSLFLPSPPLSSLPLSRLKTHLPCCRLLPREPRAQTVPHCSMGQSFPRVLVLLVLLAKLTKEEKNDTPHRGPPTASPAVISRSLWSFAPLLDSF